MNTCSFKTDVLNFCTRNYFWSVSVISNITKCIAFIVMRITETNFTTRNSRCGKVMFSQASVIRSVFGCRGVGMLEGVHPPGHTPRHTPPWDTPSSDTTVNKQPVHILLQCFLVSVIPTVTIGTMLNFCGANNGHRLKPLRVKIPLLQTSGGSRISPRRGRQLPSPSHPP